MPKIRITEKDKTGTLLSGKVSHSVLIPIEVASGVTAFNKLYTSKSDLIATTERAKFNLTETNSYHNFLFARRLLELGLSVVVCACQVTSDTTPAIDFTEFQDKGKYDLRFLSLGAYTSTSVNTKKVEMINCAINRGDCVALLDHPESLDAQYVLITDETYSGTKYERATTYTALSTLRNFTSGLYYSRSGSAGSYTYTVLTTAPSDWTENYANYYEITGYTYTVSTATYVADTFYKLLTTDLVAQNVRGYFESLYGSGTSFASAFTPYFTGTIADTSTSETITNIPASIGYLFAYARSINNDNDEWKAIAGHFRGGIEELEDIAFEYSDAQCEILQGRARTGAVELDDENDNVGIAINPIANVDGTYVIWGNRTFLKNVKGETLKATTFLSIRHLVITIKKLYFKTARKYTFEQNNNILYANFQSEINPTLEKMVSDDGLYGYLWEKVTSEYRQRFSANIHCKPVYQAEDFDLGVIIGDTIEITEA